MFITCGAVAILMRPIIFITLYIFSDQIFITVLYKLNFESFDKILLFSFMMLF